MSDGRAGFAGDLAADVTVVHRGGFRLDARVVAAPGKTVAIMGPSGAGKSTLLAALAGLVSLSAGQVSLDGRVLSSPQTQVAAAKRRTVLLGQDPRLFPHLSARENVAFGPRAAGVPAARARQDADDLLARVGLLNAGDRRPAQLSGGQQQRVALARALAASPRLVLLDEPLTSLDPVTADGIRTTLAAHLEGRTCVVVTHDAIDAVALAEDVVVIEDGRVSQSGPVREVLRSPRTDFVASLAGLNRVIGSSHGGRCVVAGVDLAGEAPLPLIEGHRVAAVFRPADVEFTVAGDAAPEETGPSPSGVLSSTWQATVVRLEQTVAGVRVHTDAPAVAVDLPAELVAARGIRPHVGVRLRVNASDVRLLTA